MPENTPPPSPEEPPVLAPQTLSSNRGVMGAAAILAVGNITSRVIGMVREAVKANLFGASGTLAAFEAAALVPTTLFDLLIGGIVSSALVPVFSDYASKEQRQALWQAVSAVLSVVTVLLLLVVALVELFTPQVAWLVGARQFDDPDLTILSLRLMRLTTPALLFLGLSSLLTGVLLALRRFTLPAFTAAVFNGTIVLFALWWRTIDGLVWGLLTGAFLQMLLQLPALRDARLRWQFDWRHPALRRILKLYIPIVAGLVIDIFVRILSYNLAISTGDENLTYMRWATTLIQFPMGLVVTALSVAILPTLSRQALSQLHEFKQTLAGGIRLVLVLILPATTGLLALAVPIVALLFQHGAFTGADTAITARVLRIYLLGLPFAAVDQMLVFASYARKDTLRPAIVGVVSMVVYTAVALLLLEPLGLLSLMVADAVKHLVHTAMMVWLLHRQLAGLAGLGVMGALVKAGSAAAIMGAAAFGLLIWMEPWLPLSGTGRWLVEVAAAGSAAFCIYLTLTYLLRIPEIHTLPKLFRRG
ncbi:MAG: murein biosynthesis integral membrane protein MurJ [Anaerolineae bacterium]|nr:murein biosynthesis integral membrane protein MurJ [Anaerolineae bacterium]